MGLKAVRDRDPKNWSMGSDWSNQVKAQRKKPAFPSQNIRATWRFNHKA
jgi:hypothetical protein